MVSNHSEDECMDIEDIIHELSHLNVSKENRKHYRKAMKHLKKLIPANRGQWIAVLGSNPYCSKCLKPSDKLYPICPNCGREMHRNVELRLLDLK